MCENRTLLVFLLAMSPLAGCTSLTVNEIAATGPTPSDAGVVSDASPSPPSGDASTPLPSTGINTSTDAGGSPVTSKPPAAPPDGGKTTGSPPPLPMLFPDAGFTGGPLQVAGLDDGTAPVSGTASTLDSDDEANMSTDGLYLSVCEAYSLTEGTGRCWNDTANGEDFIEGCNADSYTYVLDCSGYETPGQVRSTCVDDGTVAGCVVLGVTKVDDTELGDVSYAEEASPSHACPTAWNGYGYCDGNYLSMCVNGEDYFLDCSIYDTDGATYACGTDASGNVGCF